MARRAATTVVLIGRYQVTRADYRARGGEPIGLWSADRPDDQTMGLLTEMALLLGPKPGRQVLVLSTDVWSQLVRLDAAATAKVEKKDMARILAFEIEPLSNIAAFDSALHYIRLDQTPQHRLCWVNSISAGDLRDVTTTVRGFASHFLGIAHPGGVAGSTREAWQRIEFWPDLVLGVNVDSAGKRSILSINVDPRQSGWQAEVDKWRSEFGRLSRREMVCYENTFPGTTEDVELVDLDDEANLGQWLSRWAVAASARSPSVPLIRPPRRPLTTQERAFISVGMAAVTLIAGVGHSMYVSNRCDFIDSEVKRLSQPAEALANTEKSCEEKAKAIRKSKSEIKSLESDLQACREVLAIRQRRISDLLDSLVQTRPEHVVVRRIDVTTNQVAVHGLALHPQLSDILATELQSRLSSMSWNIDPAHQVDQLWLGDGGPWEFQIRLFDRKVEWKTKLPNANGLPPGVPGEL